MANDLVDRAQSLTSINKEYVETNIFYRLESITTSACRAIGIAGIVMAITLSNIFIFEMDHAHDNDSAQTIAIFLGYDWYYIVNPVNIMGPCEYMTIIIIQLFCLYSNCALVAATFMKSRWWSINWMIINTVLLILKAISMYIHLRNGDQTNGIYIFGSISYMLIIVLCLIIILLAQLAWIKDDEICSEIIIDQSTNKENEMSIFDSPAPYEHNYHYSSF